MPAYLKATGSGRTTRRRLGFEGAVRAAVRTAPSDGVSSTAGFLVRGCCGWCVADRESAMSSSRCSLGSTTPAGRARRRDMVRSLGRGWRIYMYVLRRRVLRGQRPPAHGRGLRSAVTAAGGEGVVGNHRARRSEMPQTHRGADSGQGAEGERRVRGREAVKAWSQVRGGFHWCGLGTGVGDVATQTKNSLGARRGFGLEARNSRARRPEVRPACDVRLRPRPRPRHTAPDSSRRVAGDRSCWGREGMQQYFVQCVPLPI